MTAVLAAVAAVPFVSSASMIFPGADPNGDGVIDIADVTFLYQVRGGRCEIKDFTPFDVNV